MSAIERVISLSEIEKLLAEEGAIVEVQGNIITSTDPETSLQMKHVLVQDPDDGVGAVLYNTIVCKKVTSADLTVELLEKLLRIDNGVPTSHFRLIPQGEGEGNSLLVLQNYAKLQNMGEEDVDDILSSLEYLAADLASARQLLGEKPLVLEAEKKKLPSKNRSTLEKASVSSAPQKKTSSPKSEANKSASSSKTTTNTPKTASAKKK